jgi:MtN3 and saliva related transmembrane protein
MTELLGWLSSCILLVTIIQQIWTQWRERSTKGVSKWLFVGQTAASAGFTVYSWLVQNWVFVVTNSLLLASAIVGCSLTWSFRRGAGASKPERAASLEPQSRST